MKQWMTALAAMVAPLLVVLMPPLRSTLEASMVLHMLVVFPFLVGAGGLLARTLPAVVAGWTDRWNGSGVPGLLFAISVLSIWMIPLALDRAVESLAVDVVKSLSVLLAGTALFISLPKAGRIVQLIFVWNWVGMTVFIGVLYQSLPVRLCSTYLINDQERTGLGLVLLGAGLGLAWCYDAWRGYQRELQQMLAR